MTLNEYQKQAMTTCMPESNNFAYMMLNLVGEVGEIAGKVSKYIRKDKAIIHGNRLVAWRLTEEDINDLKKECGDVLWQLSGLCSVMGWDLDDIARQNLYKLADRKQRHVVDGSGDNR